MSPGAVPAGRLAPDVIQVIQEEPHR